MGTLNTEISSAQLTQSLQDLKLISCDPVQAANGIQQGFCVPFGFVHTQCHARAEYICQELERVHQVETGKVWLYGNLSISPPAAPQYEMPWVYHVAATVKLSDDASAGPIVIDPAMSWQWMEPNDWWNLQNDTLAILHFTSRDRYVPTRDTLETAQKIFQPESGVEALDPSALTLSDNSFKGVPTDRSLEDIINGDVAEIKRWTDDYAQNPPTGVDPHLGTYWKYLVGLKN